MPRTLDSDNRRIRHGWNAANAEVEMLKKQVERLKADNLSLQKRIAELETKAEMRDDLNYY